MQGKWIIYDHHIAIDDGNHILHPNASEVYECISQSVDGNFPNLLTDIPGIRFSKIGSPIKCCISSNNEGEIILEIYVIRKNSKYPVDIISGCIIDHLIIDNEWFYLCGDIEGLQNALKDASITNSGIINVSQYIELIRRDYFSEYKDIENIVDGSLVVQALQSKGEVPVALKANLYEYQKKGLFWMNSMLSATKGCILGDEMGLGKTLQVIAVFQSMKTRGEMPVLVVAPVSLLENWRRECEKFAPELDVYIHHGPRRTGRYKDLIEHDVVVISYNTASSDLSMLKMVKWQCTVLDEAQNIKNPYSDRAKSVKAIVRKSSIAVTGTPFENHITDIWSIVDYVMPGLLGTIETFNHNVSDDLLGAQKIEPILSPIMIRRLVKDVANDLPEKVVISQPIIMSDREVSEYEQFRNDVMGDTKSGKAITISLLQKLRMYCTHYSLFNEKICSDPTVDSNKYQRLCEIVDEIVNRNEKVIVFTSYKRMFNLFENDIPKRFGISVKTINGDTPVGERQNIVDEFNNKRNAAMLVLNPIAAGTGLNITGANHVIHYNLEWNPALEDQSSARAYRRGQEKTVFIYRLYYKGTVEEVVNERIERKRLMASSAIVGTDGENEKNDIIRAIEMAPEINKKGQ